jgi:putative ABC transport system substrate-binding protein
MRRTIWIWITTAALISFTLPAMAAEKTVGVVMSGNIGYYQDVHKAFTGALAKEGFDFRKVDTILQMPSPDLLSWTNASRKLVVAEVNVLVAYGAPAALALMKETKGIPIVYAGVYDPGAVGATGKNVTGISAKVPVTSLLKYLKKMVPFTKLAAVYNDAEPDSKRQIEELSQLEAQYGFQTVKMNVKKPDDVKKLVFAGKADAVFITMSAVANESLDVVVGLARAAKIPVVSQTGATAEHGVVLALSPSATEQGEAAAKITARVLKGENPAGLTPEVPRLVELIVNLKEAGALGIKVPLDLISDATRVIK